MATVEAPQVVRAHAKYVRSSARKARIVTDEIRGRSVPEARTVLAFSQRAVARDVEKVLRSAVANAEANNGWNGDQLYVLTAFADEGPTLKRWRARARGRVARVRKRTCHITVQLAQQPAKPATAVPETSAEAAADSPAAKPKTSRRAKKKEAAV